MNYPYRAIQEYIHEMEERHVVPRYHLFRPGKCGPGESILARQRRWG